MARSSAICQPASLKLCLSSSASQALPALLLQLKRVVLYKEHWYGEPGAARLAFKEQHNLGTSCTKLPRPQPEQLEGSWDVFTAGGQGLHAGTCTVALQATACPQWHVRWWDSMDCLCCQPAAATCNAHRALCSLRLLAPLVLLLATASCAASSRGALRHTADMLITGQAHTC
jgi:hypothetical protein